MRPSTSHLLLMCILLCFAVLLGSTVFMIEVFGPMWWVAVPQIIFTLAMIRLLDLAHGHWKKYARAMADENKYIKT